VTTNADIALPCTVPDQTRRQYEPKTPILGKFLGTCARSPMMSAFAAWRFHLRHLLSLKLRHGKGLLWASRRGKPKGEAKDEDGQVQCMSGAAAR
jgi:hypothetical protein